MEHKKAEIDEEWIAPQQINPVIQKETPKERRIRRKHYKLINKIRNEIIKEQFVEHSKHLFKSTFTTYIHNIFQSDNIKCECGAEFIITKELFEVKYGRQYNYTTV